MLRPLASAAVLLSLVVVGIPFYFAGFGLSPGPLPPAAPPQPEEPRELPPPPEPGPRPRSGEELDITLFREAVGETITLPLEEYVRGVVAAEMPADFHDEALKAQAVVARTYAVRRMRALGGTGCPRHPAADVCDDPAIAQAFASSEDLMNKWAPHRRREYAQRISAAVAATRGEILTYSGVPIDAVYHSTSGGHTEDAAAVWGDAVPYLRGVPSPHEEHAPRLTQTVSYSVEEVARRLGVPDPGGEAPGRAGGTGVEGGDLIEITEAGVSGRAKTVTALGRTLSAPAFRNALDLNSTWFTWTRSGGDIVFSIRGYGHGVGMSQYGADGMARRGATYKDILFHYYDGVSLHSAPFN